MKRTTYGTRVHMWALVAMGGILATAVACGSRRAENLAPLPPVASRTQAGLPEVNALYLIQAYDTLRVKFVYHPELDTKVPVRPDGGINITGVGEFQAAGKTTEQLAREVEKASSDRLREPEVEVIVAELGRYNVWVFGEVKQPGQVPFREGMTPIQVISDRGGFTDYARADSVLRIKPEGTATRVDLTGNLPDTITVVEANEVIYVPRTFVGDAVAFVRTFRNLLPVQPRFGFGYGLD
jgi:polysaccharide export outer membrane protein